MNQVDQKYHKKTLYNYEVPSTALSSTGIVNGLSEGIINTNRLRYPWAYNLWKTMLKNTWFVEEVDFTADKYEELSSTEKRGYDLATSQLIFMDSVQTNNLMDNVNAFVTDPMVNACLARQSYEEALHSVSYAVQVESISPNTDFIYDLWKTDDILKKKNEFIGNVYINLNDQAKNSTSFEEKLTAQILMIVANRCLEGIYFTSNFVFFYALGRVGKMPGTCNNIRFINRDEDIHITLMNNILINILRENREVISDNLIEKMVSIIKASTELEVEWGEYVLGEGFFGLDSKSLTNYTKFLGNEVIRRINQGTNLNIEMLYPENTTNNLKWVAEMKKINSSKTDFFTSDPSAYQIGTDLTDIF